MCHKKKYYVIIYTKTQKKKRTYVEQSREMEWDQPSNEAKL